MKRIMMMAAMMAIVISASAMTYTQARDEALFLTDKMAYELDLSYTQYEAVYEINLDYYLNVTSSNLFGTYWNRRNADLRYVLTLWQYERYVQISYFYRPVQYSRKTWYFSIYTHYGKTQYYRDRPQGYSTYRGGNNKVSGSYYRGRDFDKPINSQYQPKSKDLPPHNGSSQPGLTFGSNTHSSQGNGNVGNNGRGNQGNNNRGTGNVGNNGNKGGSKTTTAPSRSSNQGNAPSSNRTGNFGGRAK